MIYRMWPRNSLDADHSLNYNRFNLSKGENIPVTVCIAAMCDEHTILGASDRMLTAGDVQFEPQETKLVQMTTSIVVMVAGDSGMQVEILQKVQADVKNRINLQPDNWLNVADVAALYRNYYNEARQARAANAILAPLGLNENTFVSRQKEMDSDFIKMVATELLHFVPPLVSAIFTGVDNTGAHIYVFHNSDLSCHDGVGFAAIGIGSWHAESQFMFAGHTRHRSFPETLLLTYSAKKRAEVSPGVGEATDMVMIGPRLGSYIIVGDHVLGELEKIYRGTQKREKAAALISNAKVKKYVEELVGEPPKEQAAIPSDGGGDSPTDQKDLRDIPKEGQQGS